MMWFSILFFNFPIINILWQIVASKRYVSDHPESTKMMDKVTEFFKAGFPAAIFLWVVTKLRDFFGYLLFKMDSQILDLKVMFRNQILSHMDASDSDEFYEPRNFIDIYLKEITRRRNTLGQSSSVQDMEYSNFNVEQLTTICLDFFQAGSETSSTTLSWAILYLSLYPEIQKNCWMEIDQYLGDRLPKKEDISRLIYCVATIQEIQRISCVAPATLIHATTRDVKVKDFVIPKNTLMVANLSKFMMDSDAFPEPDKFKPERFINKDGNELRKINQFVPFGMGKRICAGESLAVSELFIFFVMLIQRLQFDPPLNHPMPNPEDYFGGFTRIPKPFHVSITAR